MLWRDNRLRKLTELSVEFALWFIKPVPLAVSLDSPQRATWDVLHIQIPPVEELL